MRLLKGQEESIKMANSPSRLKRELERMVESPPLDAKPEGVGIVRFLVRCPLGAGEVLERAKSVLKAIDEATMQGWPMSNGVVPDIPAWFTSACSPEISADQAEQWLAWWRGLPPDEQAEVSREKSWSLENWLYWMEPENRQWFWWDAMLLKESDHIALAVEVMAWPFPWGSLRWLFRAAGASAVEAEE